MLIASVVWIQMFLLCAKQLCRHDWEANQLSFRSSDSVLETNSTKQL